MVIRRDYIKENRPVIKTLTKHGNSYALVIDKPILELLGVSPETPFEIVTDGQCLVLSPIRDPAEDKKFHDALEMVHKRFGRALKRLAE
jgi:antitoxin component of MazEF toxin-antitoxin module